jgi:hypothetical protein
VGSHWPERQVFWVCGLRPRARSRRQRRRGSGSSRYRVCRPHYIYELHAHWWRRQCAGIQQTEPQRAQVSDRLFDRQHEYAGYATALYQRTLELGEPPEFRNKSGEPAFKDKAGVGGLQAADLLAHAAYKRADLPAGANVDLDLITLRLNKMTKHRILYFEESTLRNYLDTVDEKIRALWHEKARG